MAKTQAVLTAQLKQEIIRLRLDGVENKQIAKQVGLSLSTVRNFCKDQIERGLLQSRNEEVPPLDKWKLLESRYIYGQSATNAIKLTGVNVNASTIYRLRDDLQEVSKEVEKEIRDYWVNGEPHHHVEGILEKYGKYGTSTVFFIVNNYLFT